MTKKIGSLIEQLERGKKIHEQWMQYVKEHPRQTLVKFLEEHSGLTYMTEFMGGIKWHQHWIKTYDAIIKELEESDI